MFWYNLKIKHLFFKNYLKDKNKITEGEKGKDFNQGF